MKKVFNLKAGAPPMEELEGRVTWRIRFFTEPKPDFVGYENVTNKLEALAYDAEAIDQGMYDPIELFDVPYSKSEFIWELVDKDGKVWSECQETLTEEDL